MTHEATVVSLLVAGLCCNVSGGHCEAVITHYPPTQAIEEIKILGSGNFVVENILLFFTWVSHCLAYSKTNVEL